MFQDLEVEPDETDEETERPVPVVPVTGARGNELVDAIEGEQEGRRRNGGEHQRDADADYSARPVKVRSTKGHHEQCHPVEDDGAQNGHGDDPSEPRRHLDDPGAVQKPDDQSDTERGADGFGDDPVILSAIRTKRRTCTLQSSFNPTVPGSRPRRPTGFSRGALSNSETENGLYCSETLVSLRQCPV